MSDYEKTIQAIRELDKIPSMHEWNRLAAQYNYLTTYTLRMISDMNFLSFCKSIRKKIDL